MTTIRTISAAAVAAGVLAVGIPVASASAATAASPSVLPSPPASALNFVPPRVGPISVDIAPTIINGKVVDPGLHVLMPGVSLPPISWTVSPNWTFPG